MKTNELRGKFLSFFKEREHKVFSSDSLVPDDATLLFTSAGMNQFKPYFLGIKKGLGRATSIQKCLRADDLEKVGKTSYHHTFFEMLGNFSFGDYFKKEAIEFAWQFLTSDLNMKEKDLWVSVYKDDKEAYTIWKDHIGIREDKIVKLGEDKNFWPASAPTLGPDGPCGPCSEIFFDKGKDVACKKECGPDCDCGRFVEIWNLVFTQFNRTANKLESLPQKNIDTGMGLERMVSVLQGKSSNFEIDILKPAVELVRELLRLKARDLRLTTLTNAIVDHTRAAIFAIADGVYPSNENRGYVIRKIIRKACFKGYVLGRRDAFLYELVSLLAELMKDSYPQIKEKKDIIAKVLQAEEEKFLFALKSGKQQFLVVMEGLKKENKDIVEARELFRFYDTYGFPLELSQEIAKQYGMKIDIEGFQLLLEEQKERSRQMNGFAEGVFLKDSEQVRAFRENKTKFVGYDFLEHETTIKLMRDDFRDVDVLEEPKAGYVVCGKSPFYPTSGGQLSDRGIIGTEEGEFLVEEVFKENEAIIHKGRVNCGRIKKGQLAKAVVDAQRRRALCRAHTATHLLGAALRKVLGLHVTQAGSLVDEDRLRFDFTHFEEARDNLKEIEKLVNKYILDGEEVKKEIVSLEEAEKEGALAFFKDKYEDKVRVVSIAGFSKELCAGTHLDNTASVGLFSIICESSISSGVRRIEAVVGSKASQHFQALKANAEAAAYLLNCKVEELTVFINKLKDELKRERKRQEALTKEIISCQLVPIIKEKKNIKGVNVLVKELVGKTRDELLTVCDLVRKELNSLFIFLYSGSDVFVCALSDDLLERGITGNKFLSLFKEELSLKGGGKDNLVRGIIGKMQEGFRDKVERCVEEFLI